jgi:hypothetical protein
MHTHARAHARTHARTYIKRALQWFGKVGGLVELEEMAKMGLTSILPFHLPYDEMGPEDLRVLEAVLCRVAGRLQMLDLRHATGRVRAAPKHCKRWTIQLLKTIFSGHTQKTGLIMT